MPCQPAFCRWVTDHPIAFALIFFVFYLIGFFTLEQLITEPVYLIHCTLDDWIPFNEWFIFAYGSWFFLIPWALITLLRRDRSNYFYLCAVMFSGMAICLLLYLLFPNGLNLRPQTIPINNPAAWLVQAAWSMDTSTNVCPSIHVASTLAILFAVWRSHISASPQTGSRRMYPSHCAHLPFHPVFKATLGRRRPLWYCADCAAASGCHAALQKVFPLFVNHLFPNMPITKKGDAKRIVLFLSFYWFMLRLLRPDGHIPTKSVYTARWKCTYPPCCG